jgi:anti-sigma B factor antagonist
VDGAGLEIEVRPDGQHVDIVVCGEVDLSTVEVLRDCLEALDGQWRRVVVDLSGVPFMDSTGISEIVACRERVRAGGGSVALRDPTSNVRRVLEITGLGPLLER